MKSKDTRRSDRVFIGILIRVSGTDVTGEDFEDEGRTVSISRNGATIVLARKLFSTQQITMRNLATRKETKAQVVGQIGGQPSGYVYGVALVDPTENIWNIRFPPLTESDKAVVRLLLGCTVCEAREVAYLNELEVEVFEANSNLSRSCQQCNDWTVWKLGTSETPPDHRQPAASLSSPEARTRNNRQNVRVAVKKITACIRQAGFGEEIVRVDDLSRGGLRFRSLNTYYEGSRIEVAVPYSRHGANIFVPARIMRSQDLPEAKFKEYGVAYLKT